MNLAVKGSAVNYAVSSPPINVTYGSIEPSAVYYAIVFKIAFKYSVFNSA